MNEPKTLPPLTEAEKHEAFEWLRGVAISTSPYSRLAYIALREWSDLKDSPAEEERYRKRFEHYHVAGTVDIDRCGVCGFDLRDPIHKRGSA